MHAYPPAAIQRAIAAGVQCIEHGHLMDEATAKLMADKGVWLSIQPFVSDEDTVPLSGQSRINLRCRSFAGTNTAYPLAKAHKLKTAFGSDMLFSAQKADASGDHADPSQALVRKRRHPEDGDRRPMANCWRCPGRAIPIPGSSASSRRARSPTSSSSTAIRIANIALIENPEKNFLIIMKDGKIYKDTLPS